MQGRDLIVKEITAFIEASKTLRGHILDYCFSDHVVICHQVSSDFQHVKRTACITIGYMAGLLAAAITRLEASPVPGGLTGLSEAMFDTASRYMPFSARMLFANRWLFGPVIEDQLSAVSFSNAMLRTTTAPTMLSGSIKTNVLPIEAVATVNFRLHPRDTVEGVIEHVRSVVENDSVSVRVREGAGRPASAVSDWNSPGFQAVEQALRQNFDEIVVSPGLMVAGSDTKHYAKVADNAFRFNPMVVTQDDLTGFHGTNEKITVANLAQSVRVYMQIIRRWLR